MKWLKYLLTGMFFGLVLTKSEVVSWYRWQELFLGEGLLIMKVFITAVLTSMLGIRLIRYYDIRDISNQKIVYVDKDKSTYRYVIGGTVFGLGWAVAGCPGAVYTLIGHGYLTFVLVLLSAVAGTFLYGVLRRFLPH